MNCRLNIRKSLQKLMIAWDWQKHNWIANKKILKKKRNMNKLQTNKLKIERKKKL